MERKTFSLEVHLTVLAIIVISVMTACSNGDNSKQTDGRVPITLTANTLTISETRAAADTALNKGYIEAGQNVKVFVSNHNTGNWSEYTYTAGAGGTMILPDVAPYYPLDGTHVDIVACHPSFSGNTFTIATDQTSDAGYLASDLLLASITDQEKTTNAVNLQFKHKMAKIIVIVRANTSTGVSSIQNVALKNVKPTISVYPKTGIVSAADGTATTITMVKDATTSTVTGAAVIPAQTISGTLLTVETNLGTATYSVDSKTFKAGQSYILTISVNQAAVGTTTAITGWTDTEGVVVKTGDDNVKVFLIEDPEWPGWMSTITMIKVEGGTYSTFAGQNVNGTISDFYISQTEITNFQWYTVMGTAPPVTDMLKRANPVELVSYNQITAANTGFLAKLNAKLADQTDGMTFMLPTEAQWEYAARGGKNHDLYLYAGNDNAAWVSWGESNSGSASHPVGTRGANSLGLYDMTGNVWEVCRDYYQTTIPTEQNDYVCTSGSGHVWRGGGYLSSLSYLQLTTSRYQRADNFAGEAWGFRIVLQ